MISEDTKEIVIPILALCSAILFLFGFVSLVFVSSNVWILFMYLSGNCVCSIVWVENGADNNSPRYVILSIIFWPIMLAKFLASFITKSIIKFFKLLVKNKWE